MKDSHRHGETNKPKRNPISPRGQGKQKWMQLQCPWITDESLVMDDLSPCFLSPPHIIVFFRSSFILASRFFTLPSHVIVLYKTLTTWQGFQNVATMLLLLLIMLVMIMLPPPSPSSHMTGTLCLDYTQGGIEKGHARRRRRSQRERQRQRERERERERERGGTRSRTFAGMNFIFVSLSAIAKSFMLKELDLFMF